MQVSKKILVSGNFTYGKNKEKDAKNLIEHTTIIYPLFTNDW